MFRAVTFTAGLCLALVVIGVEFSFFSPQAVQKPSINIAETGHSIPSDFWQDLNFGETLYGQISVDDWANPERGGALTDGFRFVLPDLGGDRHAYDSIEVYFRSCPDEGNDENYDNCLAFSSFYEEMLLYDSQMNLLGGGNTRLDFDSFPITSDRVYYVLAFSDSLMSGKTGHYKITLDYEMQAVAFKVKFNGVKQDRGVIKAKVQLYHPFFNPEGRDLGVLSFDWNPTGDGTYLASFSLSNLGFDQDGYSLSIKGEKHLQRVFNNLFFEKGKTYDLTAKTLEPGDLPLPQDGVADSRDFAYLWGHRGSIAREYLNIGDLNYDGAINMGDISLYLQTLKNKYDDQSW